MIRKILEIIGIILVCLFSMILGRFLYYWFIAGRPGVY